MVKPLATDLRKVTFRATGKAHRGLIFPSRPDRREKLVASCACPGSRNGRLLAYAVVICDGWDKATCGR